ncbi:hypothetical protein [Calidifontibacillus erzurumensis]|uniref:Uncharacterized protein n=1 Tax=Calidifontibacillus erzurumensis TaxID=2741433 RepID=A0A8J8GCP5_9BACI|nr:hypothetical protein [Calidifontibacillus erzurumensis]NSL50982.1 hypothetical protein [Calidifontibacillus erzurumensis]
MKNWYYTFYFLIIGIISFVTHEIVTFLMLGFVLITLHNIHSTLKEILHLMKGK